MAENVTEHLLNLATLSTLAFCDPAGRMNAVVPKSKYQTESLLLPIRRARINGLTRLSRDGGMIWEAKV